MNLFRNTYNDIDEIREWINAEETAATVFHKQFPDREIDDVDLETIRNWFEEHEEIASEYREYHYGKQWNVN